MVTFQTPRGTKDILPDDQPYWDFVRSVVAKKATVFGLQRIDLPMFEDERVFVRGIGNSTDIIDKELFKVSKPDSAGKEDQKLALRPEGTAGIVRAYLENGMANWIQPVKLWYIGSMFRYDRPQKGRYREFSHFGAEFIGDATPAIDAIAILVAWQILDSLGLTENLIIDINTIGDQNCRPKIKKALTYYFGKFKKDLCDDCRKRLYANPLRLLDCKQVNCEKIKENAPQIIDLVDEECKKHFQMVLEYLEEMDIPYNLNPYLVRGLDYYTKTTFEIRDKNDVRRQSALGGGGRYDGLIEILGGKATPAIGFALGLDRIVESMKEKEIEFPPLKKTDVCLIQIGEKAMSLSLRLVKELTSSGYTVVIAPGKDTLKGQLRLANKVEAKFALIIGQKEAYDDSIIVKNLDDGAQETILRKKLIARLEKKLKP